MSYTPDKWTDKELEALERRISRVYAEAEKELQQQVNEYFEKFKLRDKEMQTLVDAGEVSKAEYQQWRMTQIGRGQRFEALRDKVAERYTKANEVTNAYVNDATPGIYSLNRNYEAYTIEKAVGSCDFTLWDESTVQRLIVEEPDIMPYYPPDRALKRGIDLAYGKDQITKRVTSGVIRGLAPSKIATELMDGITTMNRESAIRAARTGVTTAQNAGRMDSYVAAEKMGIKIKKRWMCTKDARTRLDHGMADGQTRPADEPFNVGGYKMMFPGDKSMNAPGHEIYNCRCSMRSVEKDGIEAEPRQMRVRDPVTGENVLVNEMTYSEWENWKNSIANSGGSSKIELYRKAGNTGAFSALPERMSKKHIRALAKECGIELKGLSLNIDSNEELLRIQYTGRADPEKVGGITFFPNAFRTREELVRTIFHEKTHVEQYIQFGVDYVQNNRAHFEQLAYDAENEFINKLKKEGVL